MRTRLLLLVPLLAAGGFAPRPAAAADAAVPAAIARMIDQLGSPDFAEREKATQDLEAVGPAALPALRQAAAGSDPEVRRRAETLVRRLEARALAQKVLMPSRVRLVYRDVLVREALEDVQRKTGAQFQLHDPDNRVAERRLTLDTGDTTVWEALDQFCRKAGLIETEAAEQSPEAIYGSRRVPFMPPGGGVGLPPAVRAQQIQVARMQMQLQLQVQMGNPAPGYRTAPEGPSGPVTLTTGKPHALPTHYAGSVRIRALPPDGPAAAVPRRSSELAVVLEAAAEARLPWHGAVSVHVERAVDDAGQQLTRTWTDADLTPQPPVPVRVRELARLRGVPLPGTSREQQLPVLFKKVGKPSKLLKELSGTIEAQVQTEPEAVLTVDKVLESAGQTVKRSQGGSIKVLQAGKDDNGLTVFRLQVENPPDIIPAGLRMTHHAPLDSAPIPVPEQRRMPSHAGGFNGLNLLDDKGNLLQLVPMRTQVQSTNGTDLIWHYTFTFVRDKDQGEPARLVFSGSRTATIRIPFTLTDVPLR
jgi:hypothetical protein